MNQQASSSPATRLVFGLAFVLGIFLLLAIAMPPRVQAADLRNGGRVVIGAEEVIDDDLYVTASELVIDGTVKGDVYALAQTVTVNGTVEHDLMALAGAVDINGTVGDTLRGAAQTVVVGDNGKIGRSALLGAYSIETKPNSSIGRDLLFGAFQALLAGTVQQDVIAGAYGIELRGTVGRNMRVSVGEGDTRNLAQMRFMQPRLNSIPIVAAGLTIAPTATIGGALTYEAQNPAAIPPSAQVAGPVVQQTPVPTRRERPAPQTPAEIQALQTQRFIDDLLDNGRRFIILLLLGLLALWLLPKWIGALAGFIRARPLGSLGRGVLMFVGFIVALFGIVLVMIVFAIAFGLMTLGGLVGLTVGAGILALGVLAFGYIVFTAYVAPIVVSYLGGRLLLDRVQAPWAQNRFLAFLIGLIILSLLTLIPFVNVLVGILVALFALGALALWAAPLFRRSSTAAPVALQ